MTFGSPATTITLTGTGYVGGSTVTLDGGSIAATYVSGTQLQATVLAAVLATAGSHTFVVANSIPGGGTSAGASLTVAYPAPTLSSISPTSAQGGSSSVTITAIGSNFVPNSTIDWNGTALATTYVSTTQLTAPVPAGDLASATNASVTVVTSAPGGGASASIGFTVSAPAGGGGGGGALSATELLVLGVIYLLGIRMSGSGRATVPSRRNAMYALRSGFG